MLDEVYRTTEGVPVFHEVRVPTAGELQGLLNRIIKRLMKFLTRKGFLIEEQGMTYLCETDPDPALGSLQAAACTYRIAFEASIRGLAGRARPMEGPAWRTEDATPDYVPRSFRNCRSTPIPPQPWTSCPASP